MTSELESANEDGLMNTGRVMQISADTGDGGEAKSLMIFYLLVPVVIAALICFGALWFWFYLYLKPDSMYYFKKHNIYVFLCLWAGVVIISPLYILLALWRGLVLLLHKKRLNTAYIVTSSIISFSIWVYYLVILYKEWNVNNLLGSMMNWLFVNVGPILSIVVIIFLAAIVFKSCFVILGYDESKRSTKCDLISCLALLFVYLVICIFLVSEGMLVHILSLI